MAREALSGVGGDGIFRGVECGTYAGHRVELVALVPLALGGFEEHGFLVGHAFIEGAQKGVGNLWVELGAGAEFNFQAGLGKRKRFAVGATGRHG